VTGKNEVMIEKAAYANDDEIDLFDLIDDIWSHKRWVFLGLFVTVILAGLYLFQATPVYQTEAKVKSATANDLIEFTRPQLAEIYTLDVDGAFSYAKAALLSTNYRKEFYELKLDDIKAAPNAYNEELTLGQNFSRFSENFSIKTSGAKDSEAYVQLNLKSADAEFASELLNEFIEYALFRRLRDTYNTMLARIDGRIETLDYQAEVKREAYFSDKARRILKLKEATAIAIAVGQIDPVYRNMDLVGGQKPPLYMLGSKAIKAEIKALESREKMAKGLPRGEDHFIKGLPEILLEIDSLKTLEVDFSKIQLARIDEVATIPVKPIKPRKLLVVALALVAGLFIGLFMALIVAAYGKHKTRTEEKR
jgi:chain length determinant protein (polysaccharide antigen chain regulator)